MRRAEESSAGTAEDLALVRRMRDGDESAFEMFASHYVPALFRFATARLRDEPELARDVVQNTICHVIERLDGYRGESALFTWLAACCRNEIAAHFRRRQSRPVLVTIEPEAAAEIESPSLGPEDLLLVADSRALVHLALDHLAPTYAAALEWKYFHGESVENIASRLRLSTKAAESLLTRARAAFRETYRTLHGGFGTAGTARDA
jgi:RNA polymerase sigma-70 factor (ECF subfamily)